MNQKKVINLIFSLGILSVVSLFSILVVGKSRSTSSDVLSISNTILGERRLKEIILSRFENVFYCNESPLDSIIMTEAKQGYLFRARILNMESGVGAEIDGFISDSGEIGAIERREAESFYCSGS